ncbi:hypothetical protein [Herbaspirillum sp. alder98]|uniref:hypothetical protein n=1 Tax=Herbaspirillum sp. alder98 TaxID=2913096 RepID=UPI001CD83CA0|nr:hypothetical protein [Herbaspirillum sp. alder98]MCA1325839.1 hypothetical protein [Herbaspirillum sp. alder98]
MSVTPPGHKRCPSSGTSDQGEPPTSAAPPAGRVRADAVSAAARPKPKVLRLPPSPAGAGMLDISGFDRPLRLTLDHGDDCIRVTTLPRDATIEFPALPARCVDARDIDVGSGSSELSQCHAPLPSLAVAMAPTSDGATTFFINQPGGPHALRVVIAADAAPRARARLAALLRHALRDERRFQGYLRLLRSGLCPRHWIGAFAPMAGQLWHALPDSLRRRVCAYFVSPTDTSEIHFRIDFGAALAVATREHLTLLLEVLSSALGYWLERSRLDQIPDPCWDQGIMHARPDRPTRSDFLGACQRVLQGYREETRDGARQRGADDGGDWLAALLADPEVSEIVLDASTGGTVFIGPLMRDVTLTLGDVDARVEFGAFGCGRARLQAGKSTRSLAIRLRQHGDRWPRHLVSDLRRDACTGLHASVTDMRCGGGMTLHAPAGVAFDEAGWEQFKTAADFRLEMCLSTLLEWSEVLAQGHRLTREQDLRLSDHVHEMCPGSDHWTIGPANALVDEMDPAATSGTAGLRRTILMLQQLQVAQVKLYLSGALLRRLEPDRWRGGIRKHAGLASIAGRITAVQVDYAWEAMHAGRHYQALCRHLHVLEHSERDPVRRHVLCRDRELLVMALQAMTGEIGDCTPPHASELVACADDAQCRLALKIMLIGSLDQRLFAASDHWRRSLLRRLRQAGASPRRALNMSDMALIAFLRHADAAQLETRFQT